MSRKYIFPITDLVGDVFTLLRFRPVRFDKYGTRPTQVKFAIERAWGPMTERIRMSAEQYIDLVEQAVDRVEFGMRNPGKFY